MHIFVHRTSIFDIIIDSQNVVKEYREVPCTLHPVSPMVTSYNCLPVFLKILNSTNPSIISPTSAVLRIFLGQKSYFYNVRTISFPAFQSPKLSVTGGEMMTVLANCKWKYRCRQNDPEHAKQTAAVFSEDYMDSWVWGLRLGLSFGSLGW